MADASFAPRAAVDVSDPALGARFGVESSHDRILATRALPIRLLEARMREWIG